MSVECCNLPRLKKITRGAQWGIHWWTVPATPLEGKDIYLHFDNIETGTRITVTEPLGTGSDDPEDNYTGVTKADDYSYLTISLSTVTTTAMTDGDYKVTLFIDDYETDQVVVLVETLPGGLA